MSGVTTAGPEQRIKIAIQPLNTKHYSMTNNLNFVSYRASLYDIIALNIDS